MFYPKSATDGKTLYEGVWIVGDPSFYEKGLPPEGEAQTKQLTGDINIHKQTAIDILVKNPYSCVSAFPQVGAIGPCLAPQDVFKVLCQVISSQIISKSFKDQEYDLKQALFSLFCGYQARLNPPPNDPFSKLPPLHTPPFPCDFRALDFSQLNTQELELLGRILSYRGLDLHNLSPNQINQLDKVTGYSVPTAKYAGDNPRPLAYSNISNMSLHGLSLLNLYGVNARECDFTGTSFSNGCLNNGEFTNAGFAGCNFAGTSAQYANFTGASFKGAQLAGGNFTGSMVTADQLADAETLSRANLKGTGVTPAALTSALQTRGVRTDDPNFQNITY
jgi:uncharacterized protein YjbI with pentapeptide repeats